MHFHYSSSAYFKLLTKENPKTKKGQKRRYMTFILHLAPARLSGVNMCQWFTIGCGAGCLNFGGRGGILKPGEETNAIQEARIRRTRFLIEDPEAFMAVLVADIERAIRYAVKRGFIPVFRLNGTSDRLWEFIPVMRNGQRYGSIFHAFREVDFYDYTKAPYSTRRHDIPNYDLTFSYAETAANRLNSVEWLNHGHNMAVVFDVRNTAQFPETFEGREVLNGDISDLRFLDRKGGLIIALKVKGRNKARIAKARAKGFFVPVAAVASAAVA